MLCICVVDVMAVVLYCEAWSCRCSCECFVMQMYVCILCASCDSSQCCVLHDLQFVNACGGYNKRPYGRGILQSCSHNCLVGIHECLLLFNPSCFYDL